MSFSSNVFQKKFVFVIFAVFALSACSMLQNRYDGTGSLCFRITGEMASRAENASRSADGDAQNGIFLDIDLKGGVSGSKTVPFVAGESVLFEEIPVGTSVYAEAQAFESIDGNKNVLYTGKSGEITIEEGENALALVLKQVFTVTFMSDDELYLSVQVAKGENVPEPANPTKEGYSFGGWYEDSDFLNLFVFSERQITDNITLYAKWVADLIGSKASPDSLGDIVFTDGSASPYDATLTAAQKAKAVAVFCDNYGIGLRNSSGNRSTASSWISSYGSSYCSSFPDKYKTWSFPSQTLAKTVCSSSTFSVIQNALQNAGGSKLTEDCYWTKSEGDANVVRFPDGESQNMDTSTTGCVFACCNLSN